MPDDTAAATASDASGAADALPPEPPPKTTVSITVDGRPHEAQPGQLVIDACEDAGVYVPRFCYHRRMNPVGMCRQCLVEIEGPRGAMLVVSCMTPVAPDQVVLTETPTVKKAQEGVLEFLLANHPLDCPVCDKGGECPLQDQAFSHGPGESRFVEEKRHYEKPIPISSLVYLDRERCILCDRCTRFAAEVAGDPLISFTHRGNNTQVLTFPDQPFASYFSGNTVQICPVGALTAKPYRFRARPWDLEQTESTCTTCAVGCRITVQSSQNRLLRYQGVDSDPVNWGWLCDKGRFGFEAVASPDRVVAPMVRSDDAGELEATSWAVALDAAAGALRDAMDAHGPASIAVLGGARGTNEDAFAWARLPREVIGTANVDAQLADGLPGAVLGLPPATIDDACAAATVVLLGPDLKEELPVLYLRIRDAAEKRRTRLVEIAPKDTGLTPYAWRTVRYEPGEQATAAARALGEAEVAEQLARGPVVVVVGRANLAEHERWTLDALRAVLDAAPGATVLPALRRGNVRGALTAGLAPGEAGSDAAGILDAAASGRVQCLVLLGADPARDVPDVGLAGRALAAVPTIIAVDTHLTASSRLAHVVLPATGPGERIGTTTNLEGRVTAVTQKVTPPGTARPDWTIAVDLASALGTDLGVTSVEQLHEQLATAVPSFGPTTADALAAHPDGVLTAPPAGGGAPDALAAALAASGGGTAPAPPAPRSSYDLRLVVSRTLYDAGVTVSTSPSLAPLAPGGRLHVHPLDLDRLGASTGTRLQVSSPRTSAVLEAEADPRVARGTAWLPFNQPDDAGAELLDSSGAAIDLRVENLA
jgi:NADH-quinone oxidoreductase subunit G